MSSGRHSPLPDEEFSLGKMLLDAYRREFGGAQHATLPFVDPSTYQRLDCRCGGCDVCAFFASIERDSEIFEARRAPPPRPAEERARFGGVHQALALYVRVRSDGYQISSSMGGLMRIAESGVRGPRRASSTVLETADEMAAIEAALERAYDGGNDRGIGVEACAAILLARLVGRERLVGASGSRRMRMREPVPVADLATHHGISPGVVQAIVQSGVRRLRIELAARGLIPMPRRQSRLLEPIERRRGELLRAPGRSVG